MESIPLLDCPQDSTINLDVPHSTAVTASSSIRSSSEFGEEVGDLGQLLQSQFREVNIGLTDPRSIQESSPKASDEEYKDAPDIVDRTVEAATDEENNDFRATGFAEKQVLARWFPQINVAESQSWRMWISKRSRALLLHTVIVFAVFSANLGLTIYSMKNFTSSEGSGIIFQGSCTIVKHLDLWLHLLINILSTLMLMASNYCMQLHVSPTRKDIDRAHAKNEWLDIGIPSLRNLKRVNKWRRACWLLMLFSSLPIHLIYNSAVFSSLASNDYTVAVVNNAFLEGGNWNLTAAKARGLGDPGYSWVIDNNPGFGWKIPKFTPEMLISAMQQNASTGLYNKTSISACFSTYNDYFSTAGNVVIVIKNQSVQAQVNDSLLIFASIIPTHDDWAKNQWAQENGTSRVVTIQAPGSIKTWYLGSEYYEVDYCLIEPPSTTGDRCRFEYSPQILITVTILNFFKACIMLLSWLLREREWRKVKDNSKMTVLSTLGDAIASFMHDPDTHTMDSGLATKDDFESLTLVKGRFKKQSPEPKGPREWSELRRSWASAASITRWLILMGLCSFAILIAAGLLLESIVALKSRGGIETSLSGLWSLGFGALTQYTYIVLPLPKSNIAGLISNVIVANLPQVMLSLLYFLYNAMLTTFLVQKEFSQMYEKRKPLRVSEPEGIQRSTYFISLPFKYGLPISVGSSIMHWLVSQSLFLARITAFFPDGSVDDMSSFSACGYSPIALILTIIAGIVLIIGLGALGFQRYDGMMPLVATNSRAISAACHALDEDTKDGYALPIQWGVVEVTGEIGHCAFTTAWNIRKPDANHKYI